MTHPFWIFMGVDRSHFSAKLRAAIRYKQIHCMEYPPDNPDIKKRTGERFVPILISPDDETLQDTTDIIDELEKRFPTPPLIPANSSDRVICRLIELYGDEFFPMVSMRTRWAYEENIQELRRAFPAFASSNALGDKVVEIMSGYLPALGINTDTIPAIDAHTTELLEILDVHFQEHPFLLGDRLTLADCALLGPLYAHLYLDRVTRKQLYDNALNVCMWIERCNRPVPEKMGGTFEGQYPETLKDLLRLIGHDAAPILADLQAAFGEQAKLFDNSQPLPRGTGKCSTIIRGVEFTRGVSGYVVWKIQRLEEAIAELDRNASASAREMLKTYGCDVLLSRESVPSMRKDRFSLVIK